MKKQPLLNTYINNLDWKEALQTVERLIRKGKPSYIVEVNVDVAMKIEKDPHLKKIVEEADLTLVDGKPLVWIAKWQKRPVKAKISGSDLALALCDLAGKRGYSVFILGGEQGVARRALLRMKKKHPGMKIAGYDAPPRGFEHDPKELERINRKIAAAHPDLLFLCLGCPKQEKWAYENYDKCQAKVAVCAGAAVDFMAGRVKRAPGWMSDCGLEWFYRFLKEPKRLFRRYFIDDVQIVRLMWKYRKSGKKEGKSI